MSGNVLTARDRQLIRELMERGTRVLGLRLCYHDILHRTGLPKSWLQHQNPACMSIKREHQPECGAFCGQQIERSISGLANGSIHVCPFGHTDIVVPVWLAGTLAGVLYAGVCWTGKGEPPRKGMVIHPAHQWLEDRRLILLALARQMSRLLAGSDPLEEHSRKTRITHFISNNLEQGLRLADLANELKLSESRTGHLVKELFSETFSQLATRMRLTRAARLLSVTDMPVGSIALDTGFADQSHFTRAFSKHFRMPPMAYRKKFKMGV